MSADFSKLELTSLSLDLGKTQALLVFSFLPYAGADSLKLGSTCSWASNSPAPQSLIVTGLTLAALALDCSSLSCQLIAESLGVCAGQTRADGKSSSTPASILLLQSTFSSVPFTQKWLI